MGLDATEFGRPIYLPLGFRDVYPLSRWSAPGVSGTRVAAPAGIAIRPIRPQDLAMIASYDLQRSGLERGAVLENLLIRAPSVAHVAERGDGSVAGYSLGRDGHHATHIGPIVAEDQATGLALLESVAGDGGWPRDRGRAGPARDHPAMVAVVWGLGTENLHAYAARRGARRRGRQPHHGARGA